MRTWKEGDHGVSPVVATLMLVAIAAVLAGGVYAYAARAPDRVTTPSALTLAGQPTGSGAERTVGIAAASTDLTWGDMLVLLDGTPLDYDGALASDGTWCRETPDGICIPTAAYDPGALVTAGQKVRVHDAALAGKTLALRETEANHILASATLR